MKWTKMQECALEKMRSGRNVFLTGEAGTGKSEVVKAFIQEAKESGRNVLITAPTGIAADNLGGETLHRTFDADIGVISNRKRPKSRNDLMAITDIIVIDEISMCRVDLFEYVASIITVENGYRQQERDEQRLGIRAEEEEVKDLQLIVLGDFLQLPPVITSEDKEILPRFFPNIKKGYAFETPMWDAMDFEYINLTEIVRQDDAVFKKVLSKIRVGKDKQACADFLMRQSSTTPFNNESSIYLCGMNSKVSEVNEYQFGQLQGETYSFEAESSGDIKASDKFAEDVIRLKVGCKIMITVNDPNGEYKNGTMAKFLGTEKTEWSDPLIVAKITSKTREGEIIKINRVMKDVTKPVPVTKERKVKYIDENGDAKVRIEEYSVIEHEEVGSFTQYPVKLAYAITIHKSQGQTFDYVNIDPYCWDDGQFYTAVSRGKKLENICFVHDIRAKYIQASPVILKKFSSILK